jgi:hypothetical protein
LKGEIVYLYAFDVAGEIRTARVQEILSERPVPFTIRTDRTTPRSMSYYKPLTIELAPWRGALQGRDVKTQVRVYEVGALCISFRVPFETEALVDLIGLHSPALRDGRTLDEAAAGVCREVLASIAATLVQPERTVDPETYTVFCFEELAGERDANAWLERHGREVAGLLTETVPEQLSQAQVDEVLSITRTFEKTDLVVIDWDAALAVDLTGYFDDVVYVLEVATIQLEEFKTMDAKLDVYLNQAYSDFEQNRRALLGITRRTLKALRQIRVDAMRLTDEVTHISKFFGDWALARVFMGARRRFHLEHWRSSVQERLAQLDQLYTVAQAEINDRRMLLLEATIVVLFVIDLLALFVYKR